MTAATLKLNLTGNAKFKLLAMNFKFILFYTFIMSSNLKDISNILCKENIKYLYLSKLTWFGHQTLHLKGPSLIIFTNDISKIHAAQLKNIHLYLVNINGYFLNSAALQLSDLYFYSNFYSTNYYFIIQYLLFFYKNLMLLLWYARCRLIMQINALSKKIIL